MKEKFLGIGLTLLTVALWVGPIVAAFGSHNWSVRETLVPDEDQMNEVENRIEGLMGENEVSEDVFSVSSSTIDGNEFSTTFDFASPFSFPLTITEFSVTLSEGDVELGSMDLDEHVEVGASETKPVSLSGTLTDEGKQRLENLHAGEVPTDVEFSEGTLEFEASGVTITLSLENMSEGGDGGSSKEPFQETTKK